MILDAESTCNHFDFTIGSSTTTSREWDIKVTQYTCSQQNEVGPPGCLQYHTSSTGTIESYNFSGGNMLLDQFYSNCIRQNEGFCYVDFSQNAVSSPLPFKLSTPAIAFRNVGTCNARRVHISTDVETTTTNNVDTYCGGMLSLKQGDTDDGKVRATVRPFELVTFSRATGTVDATVTGYKIDYTQVPC